MKLHLNNRPDLLLVHSCAAVGGSESRDSASGNGNGNYQIQIGNTVYRQSIILTSRSVELWDVAGVSELQDDDFQRFVDIGAEVILLGTGPQLLFPEAQLMRSLAGKRIGFEVMDTPAACRTYNVLAGDGRAVVAALIS